jgi:NADH:ubiquinone oxidoreductase subunit F (NADH-binding)
MQILKKTLGKALKKALLLSPEEVIKKVKSSGLTGRGGANFLTGNKWELTQKEQGEKYLICNADEGEIGTFKDKFILENNPEALIEGILIAAFAIGGKKAFIYLRKEYSYLKDSLKNTINTYLKDKDYPAKINIEIIVGAGAYICGEETTIMNSIEGKRAEPRHKPPYPSQKGLFNKPSCINNVETLTNVAQIFCNESWDKNLRLFSVSGDVEKPGVFEEKLGTPFKDLLNKAKIKEKVKAIFFGSSSGCVAYNDKDKLDYDEIISKGAFLGNGSIIVVGQSRCIINVCRNIQQFFVHESCGKCLPCRDGNAQLLKILEKTEKKEVTEKDIELMKELSEFIKENSFCGLGCYSTNHLITALKTFKEDFNNKCK